MENIAREKIEKLIKIEKKPKEALTGMLLIHAAAIVMSVLTVLTMLPSKNWSGILMNIGFLTFMEMLILRAEKKGIKKMAEIGEDCQRIRAWLDEMHKAGMKYSYLWNHVKESDVSFRDEAVDSDWKRYLAGNMGGSMEHYLDEEKLFERCEKHYCDLVPGLLTALGILGTFLGLVFSINGFSLISSEALEQALANIVGGMNVAFYTSIYGVALSILFNLVYKNHQKEFLNSLYDLQAATEEYFSGETSGEMEQQILTQMRTANANLDELKEIWKSEFAEEIGETLGASLEPVFEDITKALNRVIGDFREEQSVSLQSVVEMFVQRMYLILDSHINNLALSVDKLSKSQNDMSEEMRLLLQEIGKTANDTKKVNNDSAVILKKFEQYMDKINDMVSAANKTFTAVENYSREMHMTAIRQENVMGGLVKHEQDLIHACNDIMNAHKVLASETQKNIELVQTMCDKEVNMAENQDKLTNSLHQYAQGTMTIFTEMKAAQLAAAVEYQKSWKILEKMVDYQGEDKKMADAKAYSDHNMMELLKVQTQALCDIQEYIRQKEEKTLKNRLKRLVKRSEK